MKIPSREIDHLSVVHADADATALRWSQLGFNLTPAGVEPRCICFQPVDDEIPNYIELVAGDETRFSLAMNVEELDGEERTHSWETDDGAEVDVGVVVGEEVPEPLPWFPVRHETPDAFMEPEWIVHPNGTLAFLAVHVVADNPAALARKLKASWNAKTEEIFDGCTMVKAEEGVVELLIWSPAAYEGEYKAIEAMAPGDKPAVVGIAMAVERARPLQALLRANNVPFALTEGDRVLVAPEQTGGLMIEFLPQN
jgi:hypothetical protein